jgi:uncharacterized protein (TIGR03000 family)
MYSVVLMMAMTTGGAETPALGHRGGGCGGGGCYGGSCYGGGGGCYGGGGGCHGRRHGRRGGGGGCCGSCYGGGGGSCYGGGGYGGCYGGGGCYGSGYGCTGGVSYGGCYGSGAGCYGGGAGCYGGGMGHPGMMQMGTPGVKPEGVKKMPKPDKTSEAAPPAATILVSLPADAKLSIDDSPTTSTGPSRVFVSPALAADRDFHYTLKAEVVRDGKPITMEKQVTVRAGRETPVTFTLPATGVASR